VLNIQVIISNINWGGLPSFLLRLLNLGVTDILELRLLYIIACEHYIKHKPL